MSKDELFQAFVDTAKEKAAEHRESKPTADYRYEQFLLIEIKEVLEEYMPPRCEWSTESPMCGSCKYYNAETKGCKRNPSVEAWEENDYCSYWENVRGEK